MRFCFVSKKLRFGTGIIGWVFVCVFCKQNAKMTKFVRKIVIFEFCKQNTLTVTLCMMPEPYLSFLQTEFKNVILAIFFVNILLGAPELWCPGTRSLVPFQADQGKGHQSSGARDFLAGRSPLRGEGGTPLAEFFRYWGFWTLPLNARKL